MAKVDFRYEIEFGLIRWCVENDSYHLIADIVGSKNFKCSYKYLGYKGQKESILNHSVIVRQMEKMMFRKPITWQSLGKELEEQYTAPYAYYLHIHRTTERLYGHSMRWFALSLLETDIREKLCEMLKEHETNADRLEHFEKANNLKRIRELVAPNMNDLFEAIDECISFLKYMNYEDILEQAQQLKNALPIKINKMRRLAQWDLHFRYMEQLISLPEYSDQYPALKNIYKCYLNILAGKKLPQNQLETLQELATV